MKPTAKTAKAFWDQVSEAETLLSSRLGPGARRVVAYLKTRYPRISSKVHFTSVKQATLRKHGLASNPHEPISALAFRPDTFSHSPAPLHQRYLKARHGTPHPGVALALNETDPSHGAAALYQAAEMMRQPRKHLQGMRPAMGPLLRATGIPNLPAKEAHLRRVKVYRPGVRRSDQRASAFREKVASEYKKAVQERFK